jgi:hypothetical protein
VAILVDCNPTLKGRRCWYYMTSDASLEELFAFGDRIGLQRAWFRDGRHPHYDIVDSFRRIAIREGARQASMREIVTAARRLQKGGEDAGGKTGALPEEQGRSVLSMVLP